MTTALPGVRRNTDYSIYLFTPMQVFKLSYNPSKPPTSVCKEVFPFVTHASLFHTFSVISSSREGPGIAFKIALYCDKTLYSSVISCLSSTDFSAVTDTITHLSSPVIQEKPPPSCASASHPQSEANVISHNSPPFKTKLYNRALRSGCCMTWVLLSKYRLN